jgi:hypothetical protein
MKKAIIKLHWAERNGHEAVDRHTVETKPSNVGLDDLNRRMANWTLL